MNDEQFGPIFREDKVNEVKKITADVKKSVGEKMTKWADKIVVGANVKSHYEDRKEGEIWKDSDGKSWTKKDGLIQTVDRFKDFKMPWFCPQCEKVMNNTLDEKFWAIKGKCFDCVVTEETKMREDGTWEAYEKRMLRKNEMSFIKDRIEQFRDYIDNFKEPTVHFSDGGYQVLAKKSEFAEIFSLMEQEIVQMKKRLDYLEEEDKNDND